MALDYKTAITALNDNDKNRLLAVYFNSAASTVGFPLLLPNSFFFKLIV